MRRAVSCLALMLAAFVSTGEAVRASDAPAFVVPGRPGVPVMINGRDASWCVVDGDFGLDRPGAVAPTVTCGPPVAVVVGGAGTGFYPYTGRRPRLGRVEIEPVAARRLPRPAESFHRVWSTGPEEAPIIDDAPGEPPPVIMAPPPPVRSRD